MAVPTTYVFKNGDNTQSTYHSYSTIDNAVNLVAADLLVKVQESGVWVTKTGGSHYTVDKPNTRIQFTSGNVPATGTKNIRIERYTNVEAAEAVFASGSAIKAVDLNKNQDQFRHSAAELTNTKVDALNPTIQGELKFEDGNGKSLTLNSHGSNDLTADRTITLPDADGTVIVNTMAHNKLLVGTTQTENGNQIMRKATIAGDVTLSHDNSSNVATLTLGELDHDLTIDNKELVFKDATGKTLKVSAHDKNNLAANRTIDFPDFNGTVIVNRMAHNKILVGSSESADGTGVMKKADVAGDVTLSHDLNTNVANITIGDIDHDLTIDNKELVFKDGTGKTLKLNAHGKGNLTKNQTVVLPDADGTVLVNTMAANKLLVGSTDTDSQGNQIMKKASVGGDVTLSHDLSSNTANITVGELDHDLTIDNKELIFKDGTGKTLKLNAHGKGNLTKNQTIVLPDADGTVIVNTMAANKLLVGSTATDGDGNQIMKKADVAGDVTLSHDLSSNTANITIGAGKIDSGKLDPALLVTNSEQGSHTVNDTTIFTTQASDARYYNIGTNEEIVSGETWVGDDTKVATTKAIDNRIVDLVDDVGGFVPLTNEAAIPAAHPEAANATTADRVGTIISIGTLSATYTPSGGTCTIPSGTLTNHSVNATITDCGSTTLSSGFGVLVETTAQTDAQYAAGPAFKFHRLTPKATEVTTVAANASNVGTVATNINAVNSYAEQYQIKTTAPTTDGAGNSLAAGDLWFDSSSNKIMMVYDGSSGDGFSAVTPSQSVLADISNVSGQLTYAEDLGSIADALTTETGNNINTVATNINNINTFSDIYRVASSAPSSSLDEGDLWYDSTGNVLKYYNGTAWVVTAAAGLSEVSEDTTPELGGHLDCNNKNLTEVGTVSGDNLQIDFGAIA